MIGNMYQDVFSNMIIYEGGPINIETQENYRIWGKKKL